MKSFSRTIRWLAMTVLFSAGAVLLAPAARAQYVPPANNRVDLNFNLDWRFIKADVANAQTVGFDDSAWTPVSLPHTWNDDRFREWTSPRNSTKADPLLPSGTYFGIGWYRKHFTVPAAYAGRKVILEFQGISRCAHFYVNGQDLGYHENGIGPCGLDVTDALNPAGTDNLIAVWVDNNFNYVTHEFGTTLPYGEPFNLNYGGLQRDVTMHISDPLYQTLPLYRNLGTQGTYVYATNIDTLARTATLTVQAEVKNDYTASKSATLEAVVVDASGNPVLAIPATAPQAVTAGATTTFSVTTAMSGIHFWAPDYPYLYQVYSILRVGGAVVDVYKTPLGVRKYKFGSTIGLEVNGHSLYLNGYAPRSTMEWAALGIPPDWLVDYDMALIKASSGNFIRPMHSAPRKVQVEAADRYGVIMTVPAVSTENDDAGTLEWTQKLDDMRDVMIYFRNNPSVYFYEACNGDAQAAHMQDVVNLRLTWDPYGGRLAGTRSTGSGSNSYGIREYAASMDGAQSDATEPLWDAEYGRGEAPRRVWDDDSPMLNPRWDGVNASATPAAGTVDDTTHKYLTGGYFYLTSDYFQSIGLGNASNGDFVGDYLTPIAEAGGTFANAYFRLQNSEDMVLENLAKYYARYARSAFLQPSATSAASGVDVGGAKIIWADSTTDGRMYDTEVTRVSGAVDGARLPKEVYYAMQAAQNTQPQVYVVGHWNYTPGYVKKTLYVVSNTAQVKLQTFDPNGVLIKDYGYGATDFFPSSILPPGGDQVNHYVFKFDNVAWQPGSVMAFGYNNGSTNVVATHSKSTAGAPAAIRLTPITGPTGWLADGSDIAMYDVEVVDAAGKRCPTYEDALTFSCTGPGLFLGGYNSGIRYTTNYAHATSGYKLNVEAGINRVFVRATRTAGTFTLTATGAGLTPASIPITSSAFSVTNGLTDTFPQKYTVALGTEPAPVAEGTAPPPPANAPSPAPLTDVVDLHYSGAHPDQALLVSNVQPGQLAYVDSSTITLPANLPGYLIGGDFIRPFQGDGSFSASTDQYQMYVSRYSYVYQLIDAANGMPNNDNNSVYQWTKLADTVTVNGRAMNIYKSTLLAPDSEVYLASNGYQNAAPGYQPGSNMYLLFIVSAEQDLQKPSDAITASTTQSSYVAANAIDGNAATRWNASSATVPQTLDLDLGTSVLIGGYQTNWNSGDTRSYKYKVEVSPDGVSYFTSLDMSGNVNTGGDEYRVPAIYVANSVGRYVRLTVTAASAGGWAAVNEFKVRGVLGTTSAAVPVITSALTASGNGAYAFSYQIAASNTPTGFAAQGLPSGLSVNGNTGLLSGSTLQSGTIPITVTAINGAGAGSAVLNVTMAAPPPLPVITSTLSYSTQAGVAIASPYTITASSMNYTPSSYSATLPSGLGLSYSTSTGKITGTPKYPGTYTIPINGNNVTGAGPVSNLQYVVTPNGAAPAVTSAASAPALLGTAFSYQIAGTNSPTLFGATNLPPGLSVGTSTGLISGTPTALGTYGGVVVSASNAGGQGTANVTITVTRNPNAPLITSVLSAAGNMSAPFNYQIAATNSPTSFSATPLPAGLSVNTAGLISGTPTAQGTTNSTIKAINASGSDIETLVITIGPSVTPPAVNSPINAVGAVGAAFSYQITATNTPMGFTAAPLPAGLTLNPITGLISGAPTSAATTAVSLGASNPGGTSPTITLAVVISPAGSDINLALNKPVTTLDPPVAGNVAGYAVDGVIGSRWESTYADPEWIYVDLGAVCSIHGVNLDWQNACGQDYKIEYSSDLVGWTNFVTPITGNKTSGWLYYPGNVQGRYVRMTGTARATKYGYSIYEFQVMGVAGPATPGGLVAGPGASVGQITLSWAASTGAQSYTIERSTNASTGFATIGTVPAPTLTYTDIDPALQAGQMYYYKVAAINAQGTSAYSAAMAGTPDVPAGIAGWRYRYFGAAGLAPTMANGAADGANPAQDGISNLLKYGLGLDPTVNYYAAGANALPVVQRKPVGAATYLMLTFTGAATDVTYNVQAASDPAGSWATLATYSGSAALNTITVQDSQPVGASTKRFMRLQVAEP